ncbi:hydantoinase/oxoprolinase family protein [Lacticaseibacillus nasuensis]|uniref:Hydantoinase oxoprolinase n=1 Tax=Lacticaseibacillus nasuensis JCM 17158 TaxID=1291734 RepID=A0A0R1JSX3_9LACO|nr:hydantoinase/oxoprolinase family protein [Lacticaseibacillus nasuensis]KRK74381.1 hydantoinase oxoprolinase [Lacticaseibacillus nasuensis JCM 17158]
MYRLGIDVGGTNTDAIILDDQQHVVNAVKRHTTADIETGIANAIAGVLADQAIDRSQITKAMLGTTQVTNAIVERKHLGRVGILRLAAPATLSIPPYTAWPQDLVDALGGKYAIVNGGYEYDGQIQTEIDAAEIRGVLADWAGSIDAVAIIGAFAAMRTDQEEAAAAIVHDVYGTDFPVTQSHAIGSLGLIERENASVLNAGLYAVIANTVSGFEAALASAGIANAQLYLTQNDGTLMTAEYARHFPILTIGSGPTNSIRGAAYLSGQKEAIVVDVGGTTTDLGVLKNGFPRESSLAVEVGGVRTNFRMPDIMSIGLGGGSIVREHADGSVSVGPDSVGYQITEKAICFGGDTLTATDVAVRLGMTALGDAARVRAQVTQRVATAALAEIRTMVETAIDKMKTTAGDANVILVGGGAIVVPTQLAGVGRVTKDPQGGVANAIGASIGQVSGEYTRLYPYAEIPRETAMVDAKAHAEAAATASGADPATLAVVEVEEVPLAYHPANANRVKIKVVGELIE